MMSKLHFLSRSQISVQKGFLSIEFFYAIMIFALGSLVCLSVVTHFMKFSLASSPKLMLEANTTILQIEHYLQASLIAEISPSRARLEIVDSAKLNGYGDINKSGSLYNQDILLPMQHFEITLLNGNQMRLAQTPILSNTLAPNTRFGILCRDLSAESVLITSLDASNIASLNKTFTLKEDVCPIAIPLESSAIEITYAGHKLFINGEILLEGVDTFEFLRNGNFVEFSLCVANNCYRGGNYVASFVEFL